MGEVKQTLRGAEAQVDALIGPMLRVLQSQPDGVAVHELVMLLRRQDGEALGELDHSPLGLFRINFILMHTLFLLQSQCSEWGWRLEISVLRVQLCPLGSISSGALAAAGDASLRDYYLDWRNLGETSEADVEKLLSDFWRAYRDPDRLRQARQTLQLSEDANLAEARIAYQRLAQQHHPDKGGDAAVFVVIREAWDVLRVGLAG